jgi:hypothetical protein
MKMVSMKLISFAMIAGLVFASCGKSGSNAARAGKAVEQVVTAIEKGDIVDGVIEAVTIPKETENMKPFLKKAKGSIAALWAKLPISKKR